MKEKPILFNGEMVRAVLEGRKTQTRRVMRPQPLKAGDKGGYFEPLKEDDVLNCLGVPADYDFHAAIFTRTAPYSRSSKRDVIIKSPYGAPGDRLWVRETWTMHPDGLGSEFGGVLYRATDPGWDDNDTGLRWKPSIHMRREDSRINLEITAVRVERVQDISTKDVHAEGVVPHFKMEATTTFPGFKTKKAYTMQESFAHLWNSINEKRGFGWDKNPWVWVVEFKKV